MKNKIKKSTYATLSQAPIKAPKNTDGKTSAAKMIGGDLRSKGGCKRGK